MKYITKRRHANNKHINIILIKLLLLLSKHFTCVKGMECIMCIIFIFSIKGIFLCPKYFRKMCEICDCYCKNKYTQI